jgi:hypothetical protein
MRSLVSALVLACLPLAACAPSIEAWRDYGDSVSCASYNITPVDPAYPACRAVFAQQRAQQQQNAMNALTNHGAYLPDQAAPYPFVGPVGVPPPQITNCRRTGPAVDCYSQIY